MSDKINTEDLKQIVKDSAGEVVKTLEAKQVEAIKTLKDEVKKEIDTLKGEIKEKAVIGDGKIEIKEEEPIFIKSAGEFFKMVHESANNPRAKEKLAEALEGFASLVALDQHEFGKQFPEFAKTARPVLARALDAQVRDVLLLRGCGLRLPVP